MARTKLAADVAQRGTYSATYQGMAQPGSRPSVMLLFREIRNSRGIVVADHMWFNSTLAMLSMNLRAGDQIAFDARVKIYARKGGSTDYHLSYPTQVRRWT